MTFSLDFRRKIPTNNRLVSLFKFFLTLLSKQTYGCILHKDGPEQGFLKYKILTQVLKCRHSYESVILIQPKAYNLRPKNL